MLLNFFLLSNLFPIVDSDGDSLVVAVHNLDLLKKGLANKNSAKKIINTKKSNFGKHPMLRLYGKHNLASKLFLFYNETQVEIFFESVFGKSKCDCRCLHF